MTDYMQKARESFAHFSDQMDDAALVRWREHALEGSGHDMAEFNKNSLRRTITRLDKAEAALDTERTRADKAEQRESELREAVHMAKLELGSHGACPACINAHSILNACTPMTEAVSNNDLIALDGYRAALSYVAADSWDGCPDCIEVLRAAHATDVFRPHWTPDETAEALRNLRSRYLGDGETFIQPEPDPLVGKAYTYKGKDYFVTGLDEKRLMQFEDEWHPAVEYRCEPDNGLIFYRALPDFRAKFIVKGES